ncbi:MAG: SH3 domain-containing protein [Devosia sp.]
MVNFTSGSAVLMRASAVLLLILAPGLAEAAATNPSGLPLPRFVTVRAKESNVRVGPGYQYNVSWTYKVAGTPVEIVQEFDVWRKIRDVDGSEGWVHQNMLSGTRAGYVSQDAGDKIGLRNAADDEAGVVAWVGPGFPVRIQSCSKNWCEVVATDHPEAASPSNYSGYVPETDLWGVYQGETFD